MAYEYKEISETLSAAKLYLDNLSTLRAEIHSAEKQILGTFEETEQNIKKTFSNLKKFLCEILEKRENDLLKKAKQAKNEGLLPLKQCAAVIEKKIESTKSLIKEGSVVPNSSVDKVTEFLDKASFLGSLPEVPESKEVPYISFYCESFYENEFKHLCLNFGEVFRIAPIQIHSLTARPGAIFIEWQQSLEHNDEKVKDIQEFRLQRAYGDVLKDKNLAANFIDCYRGLDSQFLLRDIQISQPYSFRICCKFDGTSEWSPWSIPQVGFTTVQWFSWKETKGSILTNDNKILRLEDAGKIIFSDRPPVSLNDSLEFTILEVDSKFEAFLALIINKDENLKTLKDCCSGIFLVDSNGKIFIDGSEKSTVLPKFTKGLKVCFSLEKINGNKVRVHVDSSDKRVTYDWLVGDSSHLFFACQMMSSQWKIMVE